MSRLALSGRINRRQAIAALVLVLLGVAARVVVLRSSAGVLNAALGPGSLDRLAPLTPAATALLRSELERNRLTGRGLHRVRRVARTIADLRGGPELVDEEHVTLALQLRVRVGRAARRDAA